LVNMEFVCNLWDGDSQRTGFKNYRELREGVNGDANAIVDLVSAFSDWLPN
jgi:hypothetical protein